MDSEPASPLIGVVGPCGSGKSTLVEGLTKNGFRCRHIAQEHSYVKQMWQIITKPDILIFLQSSYEISTSRRKLNWHRSDFDEQLARLDHAREHANLIIDTNGLNPAEVLNLALEFLRKSNI